MPTARPATARASTSRSRRTSSTTQVATHRATTLRAGRIAVGLIFLPRTDLGAQERCRTIVETEILRFGYHIYGWRQVPVDISVIGEKANATRPEIEQIMIGRGDRELDDETFETRALHPAAAASRSAAIAENIAEFYICSLSCRSLIYKGMFLAEQLSAFYPDLQDERFVSRVRDLPPALFDQHLPALAAGAALPHARPQRRDQHAEGQHQLDEEPRDPHGARRLRRARSRTSSRSSSRAARTPRRSTTCSRCWCAPAATRRWSRRC